MLASSSTARVSKQAAIQKYGQSAVSQSVEGAAVLAVAEVADPQAMLVGANRSAGAQHLSFSNFMRNLNRQLACVPRCVPHLLFSDYTAPFLCIGTAPNGPLLQRLQASRIALACEGSNHTIVNQGYSLTDVALY